jgi:Cid1 family poly A polymerase
MCGLNVAFDKSIESFQGYGSKNADSLGVLLFQFFRYYGHEIDFETSVMSVRAGKVITKLEKNWHFLQDNRLCVEEPFNTSRNLGNTADDTSVRGIHLELRRAFKMVSEAQLARCCDEYEPPSNLIDEVRPFERQSASSRRPTIAYPAATMGRAGRGGGRGGRPNSLQRSSNTARRASSASTRGYAYSQTLPLGNNITQTDLSLQAQRHQYLLHDQLFLQYQYLQAQERELRAQLHQQALLQGRMMPTSPYPHISLPYGALPGSQEELLRARAAIISQAPLTAPIRPQGFALSSSYGGRTPTYGATTNPPSPLLQTIIPDSRRTYRRSSVTNGSSGGSLRAHSQPPRPLPSPLSLPSAFDTHNEQTSRMSYNSARDSAVSSGSAQELADALTGAQRRFYQSTSSDRRGSEYIGYYIGHSPPLPMYSRSVIGSPFTTTTGLGIQNGSISPQVLAQLPSNPLSIPPLNSNLARSPPTGPETTRSEPSGEPRFPEASKRPSALSRSNSGPVVVNRSVERKQERRQSAMNLHASLNTTTFDASASDDVAVDTPTSSDDFSEGISEAQIADEKIPTQVSHATLTGLSAGQTVLERISQPLNGHTDSFDKVSGSTLSDGRYSRENRLPAAEETESTNPSASTLGAEKPLNEQQFRARAFQLSPVKEVRTPSPNRSRQLQPVEDIPQGASKQKSKGKAKQKKSSLSSVDQSEDKTEALTPQPNGLICSSQITNPLSGKVSVNGWQTQKKKSKHKKGSKSETDLKTVNPAGGESLPLNEFMRKGG